MEDLDAASLEDVHEFFRRYYGPNNTVLTLVGDLTPEEGFAAAERYFGHLPRQRRAAAGQPCPRWSRCREPVRVERPGNVPNDRLHIAFRLPVDNTHGVLRRGAWRSTPSVGCPPRGWSSDWSGASRSANAVQAHAMGFVDGVSLGFFVVDVADGQDPERRRGRPWSRSSSGSRSEGPTEVEMESAMAQSERSWLSALAEPGGAGRPDQPARPAPR